MILLAFATILAASAHLWLLAALLSLPLIAKVGYRSAVRANGVQMVRTGAKRATTGRW